MFSRSCSDLHFLAILMLVLIVQARAAEEEPFGLEKRVPWTSSKVIGSPEPPLPYVTEKAFTNRTFKAPLYVAREPGSDFLLVVLQGGEGDRPSKVLRIRDDEQSSEMETFLQMTNRLIYSVLFHPGYRTNGWLFVFSNGPTPESERTNRISRFTVDLKNPAACDFSSEKRIIEWRSAGHDGGDMVFGQDRMLYLSTGDGTSDSDGWNSGQTLDDLLGSILRIDVEKESGDKAYSVPRDNPFYNMEGARPEIWTYGLRNPWRMCIDEKTGQIWVGVNGQDLWETAHLVRRGENYGWSVYEGNHPFYLNRKRGPTPVVPPTIEHPHSEMRSLTGGVTYYGDDFSELNGSYVYGDYSTGQIWEARHDGSKLTLHRKIAQTELQIAAFALDHHGGLLIVDHGGSIHRLARTPPQRSTAKFPQRLSETGVFASTRDHKTAPGVIAYSVNAPGWMDGAHAERFLGVPGDARIDFTSSGGWNCTNGTVLVQTLSLEMEEGNPASRRRIETRLLTKQYGQWAGYSYRWSEDQSDAMLLAAKGADAEFTFRLRDGDEKRRPWRFPSRDECMACHSRAVNFALTLSEAQMNKTHAYGEVKDNQLRTLDHIGLFNKPLGKIKESKLVDPYDTTAELEARARSYLHVNCSVCHVEAGGGNAKMELGIDRKRDRMNLIEARPQHDTFGIENAMLLFPGDADRSVILQRLTRRGAGQMPPVGIKTVDAQAVALIREWINSLKPEQQFVRDWKMEELVPLLDQVKSGRSLEEGENAFRKTGCSQCHHFAGSGGTVGPDLTGIGGRLSSRELLESILLPSAKITEGYATTDIETTEDENISGFVEREDEDSVVIRPLSGGERPLTVLKKKIARRSLSSVSNMPAGIANTLTQKEILDLLAYLLADGKSSNSSN